MIVVRAFYLQGGGAKGAFQGGAIKALYEKGIEPDIVSGTSIGAINSYFLMQGNVDELEAMWNSIEEGDFKGPDPWEKVVENEKLIEVLEHVEKRESRVSEVYINYVKVEDSRLSEVVEEICSSSSEVALSSIKHSSLLPYVEGAEGGTADMMEAFKEKLEAGEYDGYKLDGGMLNNRFTEPLLRDDIEELYLLPLSNSYKVDKELKEMYRDKKLVVIRPDVEFNPEDTLRFEGEFCKELFRRGYETAKRLL